MDFAVSPPFFEFDDTWQEGGQDDGTSRVYSLLKDYMVHGRVSIIFFIFASHPFVYT